MTFSISNCWCWNIVFRPWGVPSYLIKMKSLSGYSENLMFVPVTQQLETRPSFTTPQCAGSAHCCPWSLQPHANRTPFGFNWMDFKMLVCLAENKTMFLRQSSYFLGWVKMLGWKAAFSLFRSELKRLLVLEERKEGRFLGWWDNYQPYL